MNRKILTSVAAAALLTFSAPVIAQTERGEPNTSESTPGYGDAASGVPGTPRAEEEGGAKNAVQGRVTPGEKEASTSESTPGHGDAAAGIPGTPRTEEEGDAKNTVQGRVAPGEKEASTSESTPGHGDASANIEGTPREEKKERM